MLTNETVKMLGLSSHEEKLLLCLTVRGFNTADLERMTGIPRGSMYLAFKKLKLRGIARVIKREKRNYWALNDRFDSFKAVSSLESIFKNRKWSSQKTLQINSDSGIVLHQGRGAVVDLIASITKRLKGDRCGSFQSDMTKDGWIRTVGEKKIIELNNLVKKNKIIEERILPERYFGEIRRSLGQEWLESYLGQTTVTVQLPNEYFGSSAEMWVYEDKVLLIHMDGELIVEVRHKAIADMLRSIFRFMQDKGRKVMVTDELQKINS